MAELTSLSVRKLADKSEGTRVEGFDPFTGERRLINPETGAAEPWPLLGVAIEGDCPERTAVPTSWVQKAVAEGWVTLEGDKPVHRPGGPVENVWATTHTFVHADALVIHTVDGDVRFKITKNPDKFVDSNDPEEKVTDEHYESGQTRVDWFYELELES